jgi:hypothetical protein
MVWGGVGTLMAADIKEVMRRHARELRQLGH